MVERLADNQEVAASHSGINHPRELEIRKRFDPCHPDMKLIEHEKLGLPECPYVERWVIRHPFGSIRLHHWIGSDDDRSLHDHPWWFITFVLRGGYSDVSTTSVDMVNAPAVRFRPALHRHTVQVNPGGAWTLLITGKEKRVWGFWVERFSRSGKRMGTRFIRSKSYFFKHGHHPCE